MPIYEFYCHNCHTIFNFLSRRIDTGKQPGCPKCSRKLQRHLSTFAVVGRAKESGGEPEIDIDESRMERMLAELTREAGKVNEDDPRQMAAIMRKFSEKTGLKLGNGMEEALARMEAGEDPEVVESEMGDVFDNADPFVLEGKKGRKTSRPSAPFRDETLYEL